MDRVTATLAISRLGERWLNMKKTIAIFVSLDLYRCDVSASHASHPCRGGRAVGGRRERQGVSGGQSGDPMAGVVSINEKQHLSKIYFGDIGALQSVGEIRCPQKRRRNYADARRT